MRGGREEEEERGTEEERGGTYPEMLKNRERGGREVSFPLPTPPRGAKTPGGHPVVKRQDVSLTPRGGHRAAKACGDPNR